MKGWAFQQLKNVIAMAGFLLFAVLPATIMVVLLLMVIAVNATCRSIS